MTKTRAMIDVVVFEALPDQFLKQVGFFVGAFGRSEPCDRCSTMCLTQLGKTACCDCHSFFPTGLTEMGQNVAGIDIQSLWRCVLASDQRFRQAMLMMDVVKAKAPLDAKPTFVGRAIDAFDIFDLSVLDLERNLAANTAERTDTFRFGIKVATIANLI